MKFKLKSLAKKWWLWASIFVIILSIITGEGFGFRSNKDKALEEAGDCLRYTAYSYEGLIEELVEYHNFTESAATYAADNCGADWNEQAVQAAKSKLKYGNYSLEGMKDELVRDDFSKEEAAYGAENCGADWYEQAAQAAKDYSDGIFSKKDDIRKALKRDGFTDKQISKALS